MAGRLNDISASQQKEEKQIAIPTVTWKVYHPARLSMDKIGITNVVFLRTPVWELRNYGVRNWVKGVTRVESKPRAVRV